MIVAPTLGDRAPFRRWQRRTLVDFLLHHFNLVVALGTLLYLTFFFLYGHLVPYSTTEEATVPVVKNVH